MKKTWIACAVSLLFLSACGDKPATTEVEKPAESTAVKELPTATADLRIYNWSDYVSPETVAAFEQNNNVKVELDFYDTSESLLQRMASGKAEYDIVGPSSTFVTNHINLGMYQKINKDLIPNYSNINPQLLSFLKAVDPTNEYTVPTFWGMNTLAINKDKVQEVLGGQLPENEWDLLFNPAYTQKLQSCGISILDSVSTVFPVALQYLGKNPLSQNAADLKAASELIKTIRPDVRRFSSSGYIDEMAAGNLCVVFGYGGDLNMAQRRAVEAGNNVNIEVLLPKTGFGIWIDTFMIPKNAANLANAYQYINHSLDPQVAATNGDFLTYAPASLPARALMKKEYSESPSVFLSDENLKNSFMYLPYASEMVQVAESLWAEAKQRAE